MSLSVDDSDRLILELQCMWSDSIDDNTVENTSREFKTWLESKMPAWKSMAGLSTSSYTPYFVNDAIGDQNVTSSYRNCAKLKSPQAEMESDGMFSIRAGGFKY
jgi:hypothetical protein